MPLNSTNSFFIGCNYWASHAGTRMWSEWDEKAVENDLNVLREHGMEFLRIFPLWPDFQPIVRLYSGGGYTQSIRIGDRRVSECDAGLNPVMLERFACLLTLCEERGFKVIVSLINGFMSGQLFVPPALQGQPILSDPEAVMWQIRYVKAMVSTFKNSPCIVGWDLGNECNNIENVSSSAEAYRWTATISNAIKATDQMHPVISGMHSLSPCGVWSIRDQGELTDILTTHPYPYWVRYCDADPIDTVRPILHGACESLYYAGLGGKPCFVEEFGNMGPFIAGDEATEAYVRAATATLWAHGCLGALWWCAFDQYPLMFPPYDFCACENELGLMNRHRQPKPVLKAFNQIKSLISENGSLPPHIVDAVCIVGSGDSWASAYSAFILAKQAHIDITFRSDTQQLPDAPIYLVPSLSGTNGLPKQIMATLFEKVNRGAILYLSVSDGYITNFEELIGLSVRTRYQRSTSSFMQSDDIPPLPLHSSTRFDFIESDTHVLLRESDGNPSYVYAEHGKGRIYFLSCPIEDYLARTPHVLENPTDAPYYRVYEMLRESAYTQKAFQISNPQIGMTEHIQDADTRILVLINYSGIEQTVQLQGMKPFNNPKEPSIINIGAHETLVLHRNASKEE